MPESMVFQALLSITIFINLVCQLDGMDSHSHFLLVSSLLKPSINHSLISFLLVQNANNALDILFHTMEHAEMIVLQELQEPHKIFVLIVESEKFGMVQTASSSAQKDSI